jgi:RimJ/RimL family protein N-acetyltransferase
MKRLMLEHAFRFVDSVIFRVGETNFRSLRAVEKIGAVLTERRDQVELHGKLIEHVVYRINRPLR